MNVGGEDNETINWWDDEQYKETIPFPITVIESDNCWFVTCNEETKALLGDGLYGSAQGETKEEAINNMFMMIRSIYDYSEESRLNFQRFVPFMKGDWGKIGGQWFTIFGFQFYFRYGTGMKGGWYIPLTKLNISVTNKWQIYRKHKRKKK